MYEKISQYYGKIFPLNNQIVSFLQKNFTKQDHVLDIACGDGKYTDALSSHVALIEGVDLDEQMITTATRKYLRIAFHITSFAELQHFYQNKKFDGLFCIGNSLAHIGSLEELDATFEQFSHIIKDDGTLIIATINFDRIFAQNIHSLPTITNENITFDRTYTYDQAPYISFDTQLIVDNTLIQEGSQQLYGITHDQMKTSASKASFSLESTYGNYNEEPWSEDSFQSIYVFRKK